MYEASKLDYLLDSCAFGLGECLPEDASDDQKSSDESPPGKRKLTDEYFDVLATANYLDLTPRTICEYLNEEDGLPHIKIGRKYYIHPDDLREWIARKRRRKNVPRQAAPHGKHRQPRRGR